MRQVTEMGNDFVEETVLVPVDFCACSKEALLYACREAEHMLFHVVILHVVHDSTCKPGRYGHHDHHHVQLPIAEVAAGMLENWLHNVRKEYPELQTLQTVRTRVVSGLPGKRILEVAALENASRIVMGIHDRNALKRLLHGSVAGYVSKHAKIPVKCIKEGSEVPEFTTQFNRENLDRSSIQETL